MPASARATNSPLAPALFESTGALTTPREVHAASLLPNEKVLVAGGVDGLNWLATAELYNPATGRFSPTGPLHQGRSVFTLTLLPNGKVLAAGGNTTGFIPAQTAELYDPLTGQWTPTGSLNMPRAYHTATLLPDGKVLVTGGARDDAEAALTSAELYDPATGEWTVTGPMLSARAYHTATLLPNGTVLVAGGGEWHEPAPHRSAEIYDPQTGLWSAADSIATARKHHTATLLRNGQVLVTGGVNDTAPENTTFTAELFDSSTGRWTPAAPMTTGRYAHRAALLPDGEVLVSGGARGSGFLSSSERYNAALDRWTATPPMLEPRAAHTETLLNDGTVLITGGVDLEHSRFLAGAELYVSRPMFLRATVLPGGAIQMAFTNSPGATFHIYSTTNLNLPFSDWNHAGPALEIGPGKFQFIDPEAANGAQRFFTVAPEDEEG